MRLDDLTNQPEHSNVQTECQNLPARDHMVTTILKPERPVPASNQIMLFLAGKKMFGERSNVVIRAIGEQGL